MSDTAQIVICVGVREWREHGAVYRELGACFGDDVAVLGLDEDTQYRTDWLQPIGHIDVVVVIAKGILAGGGGAVGKYVADKIIETLKGRPKGKNRTVVVHGPKPGQVLREVRVRDGVVFDSDRDS